MAVWGDPEGLELLSGGRGMPQKGTRVSKQSVSVWLPEGHSAKPLDTPGVNLQSLSRVTPGRARDVCEP